MRRISPKAPPGRALGAAILAALSLATSALALESQAGSELVSRSSGKAGALANRDSSQPAVSRSGRFVAFQSMATNLTPEDADRISDIYVRDVADRTTLLISRASSGAKGDDDSEEPSISADGRFVAFTSWADNLTPGASASRHIFVRDLDTGTTTVVDCPSGESTPPADADSTQPSISANGRFVAFTTPSALDPADTNETTDVYVRDLATATTTLASRESGPDGAVGAGLDISRPGVRPLGSTDPSISGDGGRVAFLSFAENLGPPGAVNENHGAIFVRDLTTDSTELASRASGANGKVNRAFVGPPSISANGRRVAFSSASVGNKLHPRDRKGVENVYVRDLEADRTLYVSRGLKDSGRHEVRGADDPSISANGRHVAFSVHFLTDRPAFYFRASVRDLKKGRTNDLPEAVTKLTPDASLQLAISGNGREVGFQSQANRKRIMDVFVAPTRD